MRLRMTWSLAWRCSGGRTSRNIGPTIPDSLPFERDFPYRRVRCNRIRPQPQKVGCERLLAGHARSSAGVPTMARVASGRCTGPTQFHLRQAPLSGCTSCSADCVTEDDSGGQWHHTHPEHRRLVASIDIVGAGEGELAVFTHAEYRQAGWHGFYGISL